MRSPLWSVLLYGAAFVPYAACLALYGCRSRWRRSRVGRAQFTLYAVLALVLGLALLLRLVPLPYPVAVALAVTSLGAVAVAGWVQFVAILRAQSRDRRQGSERS